MEEICENRSAILETHATHQYAVTQTKGKTVWWKCFYCKATKKLK